MSKKKKEGDDMCSLGSYSSKLNKNGYQFIKEIINSKKLPFIAQAYYSVLNLFILLLIIEIIFSALYKTQQFEIAMGKFNNFKSSSDMESNYKRSLSASIRYKASETYANINSTQSEIEKVIALQDIQNSLEFEQEKDIVLNMIQSNSEEISYIYFDNYMNQNTINNENTEFLIEISYQQIKQLANSSPAESIFSSSLLNLMYNMDTFVQTVDNLLLHNKNDILSNLNDIERMSYITSIIFSIFCILITIAAFPLAKKLSKHEQKIVLLVSRISIDEISKELHKFQVCLDSMNSKDESFLSSNFYSILEFSSSSQEDNEKDIITNKKKSLHKSNSFHKQIPKKNANGVNSRILDHRVGMMKFFISIGLTSIFSALFFCLTMSYTLITNPSIKSSFELTMQSLKARSNFGSFNVNGEILAELNYFNEVYQNFPDQTSVFRQQVLNETKYDVVELQNFSSDVLASMIYYSSEILSVDSGYASILKLLFSKNLCTAFKSCQNSGFSVCQTLPPNCNDFEQGISGIISTSFQLYGSYELIFSSNAPSTTTSLEFIHSSEFMTMIAQGFLAPDLAFAAFSQICLSAVEGIGNSISFALTIIYALVGPLLLIGTIIFLMIHWRHLKHNLISLNFLLLFIPQQKLQEDITIHILKAIRSS